MKKIYYLLSMTSLLANANIYAEDAPKHLSGTVATTSNYVFRGASQTENDGALQGSLTYEFPIGLYVSSWGSNVKFEDSNANTEIDAIIGWRGDVLKELLHIDVSAQRYNYIGMSDMSYNELIGAFSYKLLVLNLGYSADDYASHKTGMYANIGINYDIPAQYIFKIDGVSLLATVGHSSLSRAAGNSYRDYYVGLTKAFNDTYSASVAWTTTNGRQQDSPYDSTHIFGMVTASF
jgi:uncharacterized protein (TIGR02001 family)